MSLRFSPSLGNLDGLWFCTASTRRGLGGVKSGVGGDWTFTGVEQAGDSTKSPFVVATCGVAPTFVSFELFLLCAGGVGGRSMLPNIFLLVCFRVLGLEVEFKVDDLVDEGEVLSVSNFNPLDALAECVFEVGVK